MVSLGWNRHYLFLFLQNQKQASPKSAVNDLVWFMECHKSNISWSQIKQSWVRKQTGGQISTVYLRQPAPGGIFFVKRKKWQVTEVKQTIKRLGLCLFKGQGKWCLYIFKTIWRKWRDCLHIRRRESVVYISCKYICMTVCEVKVMSIYKYVGL